MRVAAWLIISGIAMAALEGCAQKKPDPAQEVRAFMASWERAIDTKNPTALDSLLAKNSSSLPLDPQRFLAEIYNAEGIREVNLVGRELDIGDQQAVVTGRLVRSGLADSLAVLSVTLIKTNKGWKLSAYRFMPYEPLKDTANLKHSS